MKKMLGILQKVGKSLMLPVATLPAAGILMAFGGLFQTESLIGAVPFLGAEWVQLIAYVMEQAGGIVFDNLGLLFAVAVAIGLSENDGSSALAAVVGFLMLNISMGAFLGITVESVAADPNRYASIVGIPTLQTGVFGGIVAGLIAAYSYNKYHKISLPDYLGYFSGKRFVPIVTAVFSIIIAIGMAIVWPPIQNGINAFADVVIRTNVTLAAFIFGFVERALVPFGLHHIFVSPFWHQLGTYASPISGEVFYGDQTIFFQQMRDGVELTAGTFLTGKFPFMMLGYPAMAYAMYKEARPENKKNTKSLMFSGGLTAFLTGITEPLDFSFVFVAPILYLINSFFAGISFAVMELLNVRIGLTLSGGLIDFTLFGVLVNRTRWWLVIPVGLALAVLYYFSFRFVIRKLNLQTPGRQSEESNTAFDGLVDSAEPEMASWVIIEGLGGIDNIHSVEACITRLRTVLHNTKKVNEDILSKVGSMGIVHLGDGVQVILGGKADNYGTSINAILRDGKPRPENIDKILESMDTLEVPAMEEELEECTAFNSKIVPPICGNIISISEVNDPVFSAKMMGDGFGIAPAKHITKDVVISPVSGEITTVFPTNHAIGITAEDGLEIIVHVGIDTVGLKGEGFESLVSSGQEVKIGEPLLIVDFEFLKEQDKDPTVIVACSNLVNQEVELADCSSVESEEEGIILLTSAT